MKRPENGKRRFLVSGAWLCVLLVLSACQDGAGPIAREVIPSATTVIPSATTGAVSLTVPPLPTPLPSGPVSSGPVFSGSGPIPLSFPHFFSFGVTNGPGEVSALDTMRRQNGTVFPFRYQYLSGGVNTGHGWETWNQPAGQFATSYMQESAQHGYETAFVYYELCQSNGPQPGSFCAGRDYQQDPANLTSPTVMKAYYANWVLLLRKIAAFGKPVLIIVEPDLWGYLQQSTHGDDNAASVPASVSSSGFSDAVSYPNTVQGFAWALLHMRDIYARNALLAIHASLWATNTDIGSDTRSSLDLVGLAQREARFLNSAGLQDNPAGVSTWDLLSNDVADHDSGQPGARSWWDRYNRAFPNFARYLTFISMLNRDTHRRVVMWQVPIGNQYFDTMNNSPGHYQDNRAEYILGHVTSFAAAGIISVLFGPGNGGTMNTDRMHDGVTNPAPIDSYECHACNTHVSSYSDDDGGYLRLFIGAYMQHPIALSPNM